jgi:hypothetical protein
MTALRRLYGTRSQISPRAARVILRARQSRRICHASDDRNFTIQISEVVMTWGIPTHLFLQIHVALSLIAMVVGLIVLYGLLEGRGLGGWIALFLATAILTSVTGFPLPPFGFDPPRAVGIVSLLFLAVAVLAIYIFRLAGSWRWIFVAAAATALYLDVFVGIVQAFAKISLLHDWAPTQSDPPFVIVQLVALAIFVALGIAAARRFHPAHAANA